MKKVIQDSRMKEALDLPLGGVEISNALGKCGLIKRLTKALLERALAAEMDDHLGYDCYSL